MAEEEKTKGDPLIASLVGGGGSAAPRRDAVEGDPMVLSLMERAVSSSPFKNAATPSMSKQDRKKLRYYDRSIGTLVKQMEQAREAGDMENFRKIEDEVRRANFLRYKLIRDDRRGNQNVVENFVDDASDIMTGFWELGKMAAKGGWAALTGEVSVEDAYESTENLIESLWDGIVDGFEKWEKPGEALTERPLESALDLLAGASVLGGVLGTGVNAGGKLAQGAKIGGRVSSRWAKLTEKLGPKGMRRSRRGRFISEEHAQRIGRKGPDGKFLSKKQAAKLEEEAIPAGLRRVLDIEVKPTTRPQGPDGRFLSDAAIARQDFLNPIPNMGRVSRALTGGIGNVLKSGAAKLYSKARTVDWIDEQVRRLGATMPAKEARKIASRIYKEAGKFIERAGVEHLKAFRKNFPEIGDDMMRAVVVELTQVNKGARLADLFSKTLRPLKRGEKPFKSGPLAGTGLKWNERTNLLKSLSPDDRALMRSFVEGLGKKRGKRKTEAVQFAKDLIKSRDELYKNFGDEIKYIENLKGKDLNLFNKVTENLRTHQALMEGDVVGKSLNKTTMQARRFLWINRSLKGKTDYTTRTGMFTEFSKKFPDLFDPRPVYFTPVARVRKGMHKLDAELHAKGLATSSKLHSADDIANLRKILDNKRDWKITPQDIIAYNTQQTARLLMQQNLAKYLKSSGVAKRVKNLSDVTEEMLRTNVLWTPSVVENILLAQKRFGRSVERMLKRDLADPNVAKVKGIGPGEVSPEGLIGSFREVFKTQFHKELLDDAKKIAAKADEVYLLPKEVAATLSKQMGQSGQFIGLGMYDTTMSLWRNTVLHWNPGWYIQNMLGNTILAMMGGHGPVAQGLWSKWGWGKSLEKYLPDEVTAGMGADTRLIAEQLYKEARTPVDKLMAMSYRAASPDFLNKWANHIENAGRSKVFLSQMSKEVKGKIKELKALGVKAEKSFDLVKEMLELSKTGKGKLGKEARKIVDDAVDHVNQTLFDYYNLTAFERNFVRRIFPFWTWTRNINMAMARFAARRMEHPLKNVAWQRLSRLGVEMRKDETFPSWLKHAITIGGFEDGSFLFLDTRRHNPFLTVGTMGVEASAMSPLLKVAYERSTGVNTWTKKPFKSGDLAINYGGKVLRFDERGKPVAENFVPSLFTHILDQFPQHYWLDNALHPYMQTDDGNIFNPKPVKNMDGTPKYPKDITLSLISAMGIPLRELTKEQVDDMRRKKARSKKYLVRALKARLRAAPRDERIFIKEAIRDVTRDAHKTLHEWDRE